MYHALRHATSGIKNAARSLLIITMAGAISISSANVSIADAAKPAPRNAAIVVDANTGKTLYSSNADAKRFPASLTKMMTVYMIFEAMQAGRVNKNTKIPVSKYAASRPPTKIGFKTGQTIPMEDAVKALITRSANDVAAAVGEYLGGSEARFAQMMTAKARRLGMRSTTFRNASGLPNANQMTTARDMALLGIALRQHFPQQYHYFSTKSFQFRGQTINGHNRLLGRVQGVDGIKTGYTNASGYNLVSSVNSDGRRIVAVVMGGNTGAARDQQMTRLIAEHLPKATRSRQKGDVLMAARKDAPVAVAASNDNAFAPLPVINNVPLPAQKILVASNTGNSIDAIGAVIAKQPAVIPAPQPELLALAAPTPRPAAELAAENIIAVIPTPKADIPAAIDPVMTASATRDTPTPQTTTVAAVSGDWAIQIGSLPSEGQAHAMLDKAIKQAGKTLRSTAPMTETFNKDNNTYFRARFVGFETKTAAWDACSVLKKKSFNCYAIAR